MIEFEKLTLFPETTKPTMGFRDIYIHNINTNLNDMRHTLPQGLSDTSEDGLFPPLGIKPGANVKSLINPRD